MAADLVLFTVDNVFFYVHSSKILHQSANRFGGLVPEDMTVRLALDKPADDLAHRPTPTLLASPYLSHVLNVILHLAYGFSVQTYRPTIQVLHSLVPALQELGYAPHAFLTPGSEIFNMILQAAAEDPLKTYALAAQYALEPLAVAVSELTLSGSLSDVNDEQARQMGPKYLKRLFCTSPSSSQFSSAPTSCLTLLTLLRQSFTWVVLMPSNAYCCLHLSSIPLIQILGAPRTHKRLFIVLGHLRVPTSWSKVS